MKKISLVVFLLLLLVIASTVSGYNQDTGQSATELPAILLKSRSIEPTPGIDPDTAVALKGSANRTEGQGFHALVQLDHIPDSAEKAGLASQGINLQTYLPEQAWVAHITTDSNNLESLVARQEIAWVGALLPTDKIEPNLSAKKQNKQSFADTQDHLVLNVEFHPDINLTTGSQLLEAYDVEILDESPAVNVLVVGTTVDQIDKMSTEDAIMWLEQALPGLEPVNNNTAAVTNVDNIRNTAPYNLNGTGIDVLVYDGGVASHSDYNARRLDTDGSGNSDHATHVAGTVLGSGAGDANAQGMAPSANLISYGYETSFWELFGDAIFYDKVGDIEEDLEDAKDDQGADIGTASLGSNVTQNGYSCNLYGNYFTTDRLLDSIVRGKFGEPYILTWAAGNERGKSCDDGTGWRTTGPPANAKNPIHVCATNMAGTTTASFSSWGPTDDGRLKPTLCAPGSTVYSTRLGNTYGTKSGTSMATPAVAGITTLMLEQFRTNYNTSDEFLPATAKAILINTSTDMGNTGPDFQTGYGLVDAQAAVDTIRENRFREGTMRNTGETKQYRVLIPVGTPTLQVSLAWDDERGSSLAAKELINDLDLVLIEPNGTTLRRPWILDPSSGNEGNNATTGIDDRNNQEQVTVTNPTDGWWTIEVRTPVLATSNQTFGLASSHTPWTFELLAPTTVQPADAGYFLSPSKFLVRLLISDGFAPSTNIINLDPATELEMVVGSELIPGTAIISSGPVGDEYHMIVRAPAQGSDGPYDFTANFAPTGSPGVGFGEVESNAVFYQSTPVDPKALSVVTDTSGSMGDDGKLDAAKGSTRDIIFMREVGDAVAQVEFNDSTNIFQPLTDVTAESDLNNFANNVAGLSAGGWTGLGQGALDGYLEIEPDSRIPSMVLLSDGMENRDPLWKDVRDSIPRNVPIHTVSFGEDSDMALMEEIAVRHDGDYHHVPTGLGVMRAPSAAAAAGDVSVATHIENRLADVYQFISNDVNDYERHREWSNTLAPGATNNLNFTLSESVPHIFFTTNWANSSAQLELKLFRPGGAQVLPADVDAIFRKDVTSERFRMVSPGTGTWQMQIKNIGGVQTEYLATVEGPADTDLMLITPSIGQCRPTVPIRICGGLTDSKGFVPGAQSLILHINTFGGERQGKDIGEGQYCFDVSEGFPEGPNSLKLEAFGFDRNGKPVSRVERQSFYCGSREVPPVLLVNDDQEVQGELFYPERDAYISALNSISIAHDVWDTQIDGPPSRSILQKYDVVIWLTAEDRTIDPKSGMGLVDPESEEAIRSFLKYKEGNIFALSSRRYLDFKGVNSFANEVLGVDNFTPDVAAPDMRGLRNSTLGHEFGAVPLASLTAAALEPGKRAQANFVHDETVGLANFYEQGCSAFFSLPLEALAAPDLQKALNRVVNWDCAPVEIAVDTSATNTSPTLSYGHVMTEVFTIENTDVGALSVELNNGPTHLWMVTDSTGGVPSLLAPYDVGDLPSPIRAPSAVTAFNPSLGVSRVCEVTSGISDCCTGGVCTQEMLLDNDIALLWNNSPFADKAKLGDMLADYLDLGGTVLLGGDALPGNPAGIEGRFAADGYSPLMATAVGLGNATQDIIVTPGDSLFANVVVPIFTTQHSSVDVPDGPGLVTKNALWDSGELMIATRTIQPGTAGQVIAYNGMFEDGMWNGDLDKLIANALGQLDSSWRQPGWFATICSEIPNATTASLPIVFDPEQSCPLIQEGVNWQVGLQFDAGFVNLDELDPNMPNIYKGKIAIAHNDIGKGRINIPISLEINASKPYEVYLPMLLR